MPSQHLDADAFRLAVILVIGGWLAVDLSPLGWPYYWWLAGLLLDVAIYLELRGPGGDDLDAPGDDERIE